MASRRRTRSAINVWPGYVDALSALLMLVIFMLLIYVVSQLYLSQTLHDRNDQLARLSDRLAAISEQLGLERDKSAALEQEILSVQNDYSASLAKNEALQNQVDSDKERIKTLLGTQASLQQDIQALRELRQKLEQQVAGLRQSASETDTQLGALRDRTKALQAELGDDQERTLLAQEDIDPNNIRIQDMAAIVEQGKKALAEQKQLTASQQARMDRLSSQIDELQNQLNQISAALKLQKDITAEKDAKLADMGRRINTLLAQRVNKLERYQSEFFGRLREILEQNKNVRVVGDRFLLPSELLFASGSAQLGEEGKAELDKLAAILLDVAAKIPSDVDWILRVDGHTDRIPIHTDQFPSNWELSTARAVAVVRYLAAKGVPEKRMAAAGFGEFFPVDKGSSPEALQRNRRIELKLTDR